jgi:hypothetical protein
MGNPRIGKDESRGDPIEREKKRSFNRRREKDCLQVYNNFTTMIISSFIYFSEI